jgi:hypothetical protein
MTDTSRDFNVTNLNDPTLQLYTKSISPLSPRSPGNTSSSWYYCRIFSQDVF